MPVDNFQKTFTFVLTKQFNQMVDTLATDVSDARERIKAAASRVFSTKGLDGARMQDIADEARINKAMLHYYFRNKQQLFEMIFEELLTRVFSALEALVADHASFEDRIRAFVSTQITIISEFPAMPLFVLLEARKDPELLSRKFVGKPLDMVRQRFSDMVDREVSSGRIRPVTFDQLFINILSLSVYPVVAEPMIRFVLGMESGAFQSMIENRKTLVADLIIRDLNPFSI